MKIPLIYVFKKLKPYHIAQICYDSQVPKKSLNEKQNEQKALRIIKEPSRIRNNSIQFQNICQMVNNGMKTDLTLTFSENKMLASFFKNLSKYSAIVVNKDVFLIREQSDIIESEEYFNAILK
jgi:hypothetical protein